MGEKAACTVTKLSCGEDVSDLVRRLWTELNSLYEWSSSDAVSAFRSKLAVVCGSCKELPESVRGYVVTTLDDMEQGFSKSLVNTYRPHCLGILVYLQRVFGVF